MLDIHLIRRPVANVSELRALINKNGGVVIQYQKVASLIIVGETSKHWEWVSSSDQRIAAGLKYSLKSMLLGWWSPSGLMHTPAAIMSNSLGGIDVTELVLLPPPLPGKKDLRAAKELDKEKQRYYYAVLIEVIAFFAGIMVLIYLGVFDSVPQAR